MALSFRFGNVDITALPGIELLVRDVNSYPSRQLSTYKLARADKSVTTSAELEPKTVRLSGNLKGNNGSRQDAESKWSVIKSYLGQREQILTVTQYGADIQYTATLARIADEWTGGLLEWALEFIAADPVGYETANSTLIDVYTNTNATDTRQITVEGSHYAEPVITVEVNSGTGLTSQSLTLRNAEIGSGITITRTWAAGETLIVDSLNKMATVDGSKVDYSGSFLKFFPGSRTLGYIDTFTTRSVSIQGEYVKRYA